MILRMRSRVHFFCVHRVSIYRARAARAPSSMHAGSLALATDNTTKRAVYVSSEEKLVAAEGALRKMNTSLLLLIMCASSCLASRLRRELE